MSWGNVTFYFSTKEHLLAVLVKLLCRLQWKRMEETAGGYSSVMAICLELTALASACEADPVTLETRISGARNNILGIFGIPEETRQAKRVLEEFREYVEQASEQTCLELLKR